MAVPTSSARVARLPMGASFTRVPRPGSSTARTWMKSGRSEHQASYMTG
eukprot:CAMPEP_0197866628 /NCGR_PEP_ID=MMETSP1438-20131217/44321_1 /TAXON_ID=1461541 /ORGANISM="Pterosperma sp., Strain CCMP1384" /LENGTH=48 /DNA_ID= /DNA_START= /DNA_END= /DNA_ORIENTATION=